MSVIVNGVYSTDGSLVSEERLKQISKSSRSLIPNESSTSDNINDFKHLLDDVFATSSTAGLRAPHRVAAWNTLCCLIDASLVSSCTDLQEPRWISQIWTRAFDLYLNHAQSAKPKSTKQLLGTLTMTLRSKTGEDFTGLRHNALSKVWTCLTEYQAPHAAKASVQLLGQLLLKDILALDDVLEAFGIKDSIDDQAADLTHSLCSLLETLFQWLSKGDFGSSVAQLVAILLDKYHQGGSKRTELNNQQYSIWMIPLQSSLFQGSVGIDDLRAHILPVLFKRSFADFVSFLNAQGFWSNEAALEKKDHLRRSAAQEDLLFASLQTGKELGLIVETDDDNFSQPFQPIRIPVLWMGELLHRKSRSARLTGLSLLITSHSATRPLSRKAFTHIQRALPSMFADVDADFRSGVFSAFQRLIDRLRAITAVLARQKRNDKKAQDNDAAAEDANLSVALSAHQGFLHWALRFMTWELRPTASYQRHISALKCLSMLVRSGLDISIPMRLWSRTALGESKWPFSMTVLTNNLQRLLVDLVMDPFDDVRQAAATILGMQSSASSCLENAVRRAEADMLRTGRADHADGVARIYALRSGAGDNTVAESDRSPEADVSIIENLIVQLEQMLAIFHRSLPEAVSNYPLHGILTSLRYVLARDTSAVVGVRARLAQSLADVWDVVKPVLCNDAPEGYAVEDEDESMDSTKETLSYCWRALKEASLLLSALVVVQSPDRESVDAITEKLSTLCFTQLAELRHRGAFSTVAQTWIACCTQCRVMNTNEHSLLETWYEKVLDMLRRNVTINTRRSAGLPSLLSGILIADASHTLLSRAVTDLEVLSRQDVDLAAAEEGSLAQVHAMNCFKDILRNSKLGEQSEPYITVAFQLAVDSLRSGVWAIRNCGLMLFRAVVDRILKTDQSHFDDDFQSSRHISTEQYPALLDTVVGLLPRPKSGAPGIHDRYEGVFAALQLLQHIQVPAARVQEITDAIRPLVSSTSWHMRDKAARSMASVMSSDGLSASVVAAVQSINDLSRDDDQNCVHGVLLTGKYVIRMIALARHKRPSEGGGESRTELCRTFYAACKVHVQRKAAQHPVTKAAFIDLVRELTETLLALTQEPKGEKHTIHRENLDLWPNNKLPAPNTVTFFQAILGQCLSDPDAAVLRQAVARFMAQQIPLANLAPESTGACAQLVLQLADSDEDACKYFLQSLRSHETGVDENSADLGTTVSQFITGKACGTELKCEALETLLLVPNEIREDKVDNEAFSMHAQDYLSLPSCNQRYADLCLEYRTVHLERKCASSCSTGLDAGIMEWIADCASAISGHGAQTREAAASALGRTKYLWPIFRGTGSLQSSFLTIVLGVYDLLNDDDEDIRLLATAVAQRILLSDHVASTAEHEPITASQKLLLFCTRRWSRSQELAEHALQQALGWSVSGPRAVRERLQLASCGDNALFAEEKQNLYIDDAREARAWAQVLIRLSPYANLRDSISTLARWVEAGLDALQAHAENNSDGPLGWSSNVDTFTLGLRVIYGAEVLLSLSKRGRRLSIKPSHLRRRLHECDVAFNSTKVNCLWRWEIQRVLAESVLHKVQLTGSLARYVAQS